MYVGLDIGGTKIYAAHYNKKLRVLKEIQISTEATKGRKQVLQNICHAIRCVYDPKSTLGIGISWAGFVDSRSGKITFAPNIPGFEKFPLKKFLENTFRKPVRIENDAKLFAWSEHAIGKAKGKKHVIGLVFGTGIGSGIIVNGMPFTSSHGFAGEVGHMLCSRKPQEEFEEVLRSGNRNTIISMSVQLLYNLTLAFDPDIIIIGGGVGERVLKPHALTLSDKVDQILKKKGYPLSAKIAFTSFKNSGSFGAALLIQKTLR